MQIYDNLDGFPPSDCCMKFGLESYNDPCRKEGLFNRRLYFGVGERKNPISTPFVCVFVCLVEGWEIH